MEAQYVHRTYDAIAPAFSHTRYAIWDGVRRFIDGLPLYDTLLDCGCGNGKYADGARAYVGLDICMPLLNLAADKRPTKEFLRASVAAVNLPFRTGAFDHSICIAVLHHLDTPDKRAHLVRELVRVSRRSVFLTVWAAEQTIPAKWLKAGGATATSDYLVPFQSHLRYYHLFSKAELTDMLDSLGARYTMEYEKCNWNITLAI
jgi:ubiquinone/menaquinone biosynthesis C-methylase UbiE